MTHPQFASDSTGPGYTPFSREEVKKLVALACDVDCTPKNWAAVVSALPAVSARILQVVNDRYSYLPGKLASVRQAMGYLGFNTLRNLASAQVLDAARLPKPRSEAQV